ncbi:MAG TPA: hypothetical protein H9977_06320 [Candidatus Parabacteroides intestinipullorum]|uniref:Glucuronosyltransferase GumK N-terminal domain-containing protein n=1 Tax=Candidatus Parabacteroides intestinipullorum TaxID=2838723 RepID=A0A9D1X8F1_9BACT|nr:hypothetical protein [Candidatus Parabacteroides intestinipullorum]
MKITFVTFHNWKTKRQGGFHKFAERCSLEGHEVVFFSFPRPYYSVFKNDEIFNLSNFFKLVRGEVYTIKNDKGKVNSILNCTWPTLSVPGPLRKIFPKWLRQKMSLTSLSSFSSFYNSKLKGTDVFVFESCYGIFLLDKIKLFSPKAKIVYRPSDPLMINGRNEYVYTQEKYILKCASLVLLVNEQGLDLYIEKIPNFGDIINYRILSNGVDLAKFKLKYERPKELCLPNIALYVGAQMIDWDVIFYSAKIIPYINFVIVCPEKPNNSILSKINIYDNIKYISGIYPERVPGFITNSDVIIIPYPNMKDRMKTLGVIAKFYQAMAANKPIVAYNYSDVVKELGVIVTYDYDSFVLELSKAISNKEKVYYNIDLDTKDWSFVTSEFLNYIVEL